MQNAQADLSRMAMRKTIGTYLLATMGLATNVRISCLSAHPNMLWKRQIFNLLHKIKNLQHVRH